MESKRVVMLVKIMIVIVMVMGNLLAETKAREILSFRECYPTCIVECKGDKTKLIEFLMCPYTCLKTCLHHRHSPSTPSPSPLSHKFVDKSDDYCKLGCAIHHCASLSSIENTNVNKVEACVDSCSSKCSN
ncbi:unnamed protein product [Cochlearia groenlandica]